MPTWLIALYLLHIGAAFYWLGSTFLVAQAKGKGAERQFPLQMLAAALTLALGVALWREMHPLGIGKMEVVLGIGAACAIGAAGLQGVLVGGALRKLKRGVLTEDAARTSIRKGHRWAAVLLAVTLLAMVGSYHV